MQDLTDFPEIIFGLSMISLWVCAWLGANVLGRRHALSGQEAREDFGMVTAASLTLLGLIIGFSFSMAINRYDTRKSYEEAEANAVGTEYLRAGLLPGAASAQIRALLRAYVQQRVLFYETRDQQQLQHIDAQTTQLQEQLWSAVQTAATAQPSANTSLVAAGMNEVLNSQGYTQAAWWNRIPLPAWILMALIAMLCNLMVGYAASRLKSRRVLLFILPLVVSIAFFLIADIDSPRGGMIHVQPQNLLSLAAGLH